MIFRDFFDKIVHVCACMCVRVCVCEGHMEAEPSFDFFLDRIGGLNY